MPFLNREAFLEESGDYYTGVLNALTRLEGELERLKNVEELHGLRKRAADIRAHLAFLLESPTATPSSGSSAELLAAFAILRVALLTQLFIRTCRRRRSMSRSFSPQPSSIAITPSSSPRRR